MKTLIVAKHSKLEWDSINFGLSQAKTIDKYEKEHINPANIIESHAIQLAVRKNFKDAFPDADVITLEEIKTTKCNDYDLVLALGGDNAFTLISHHCGLIPVLGINSDPQRSAGCLLRYAIKDIQKDAKNLADLIQKGDYKIEEWARLKATIDGAPITQAISEYFLGERLRKDMSRHILISDDKQVEQKCSGLIVATGSGSTGWYSKVQYDIDRWEPTEKYFGFVATEPYTETDLEYGIVDEGEELVIHSLNDNEGIISADSWEENNFSRGSKAVISLGTPLKVLVPNGRT